MTRDSQSPRRPDPQALRVSRIAFFSALGMVAIVFVLSFIPDAAGVAFGLWSLAMISLTVALLALVIAFLFRTDAQ